MGNLIKDFWTYSYKGGNYFGIVEVVKGDLQFRKVEGKFETHIEKALAYLMKPEVKALSHMSVQSYSSYLNKDGRNSREVDEEVYYPFFLEFEPHVKPGDFSFNIEYKKATAEAYRTVQYMIYEMGVDANDILITITNSRSIYIFVNPKCYNLKPSKVLHQIYRGMFELLNEHINFKYVDTHQYRYNGLIKTPGAFYAGGYVVPIKVDELKALSDKPELKAYFTRSKRSMDVNVPGQITRAFCDLYLHAIEEISEESKTKAKKGQISTNQGNKKALSYINNGMPCINFIESHGVDVGQRNFALVSLAISYKNAGYSEDQVYEIVQAKSDEWGNDESKSIIRSKVRVVFRKDYNFSCEYVKENLSSCSGACSKCKMNKAKGVNGSFDKFKIDKQVISVLQANKASLRHYKTYLIMARNNLFGKFFFPEDYGIEQRVIREFAKYTDADRELNDGLVKVIIKATGKTYTMANSFIDKGTFESLGERLKHYLLMLVAFTYRTRDKYVQMHVKPTRIAQIFGYKDISSAYYLIRELIDLGLLVFNNGCIGALLFESNKIISMEEYKKGISIQVPGSLQKASGDCNTDGYELISMPYGQLSFNLSIVRGSP